MQAFLVYNQALCCYKLKQYSEALKYNSTIIESALREHPELNIGTWVNNLILEKFNSRDI